MQDSYVSDIVRGRVGILPPDSPKPRQDKRLNKMEEELAYAEVRCNSLRDQLEQARKTFQNVALMSQTRPATQEKCKQRRTSPSKLPKKSRSHNEKLFANIEDNSASKSRKIHMTFDPPNKETYICPRADIAITIKRKKDLHQSTAIPIDSVTKLSSSADKVSGNVRTTFKKNVNRKTELSTNIGDNKKNDKRRLKTALKKKASGKLERPEREYENELGRYRSSDSDTFKIQHTRSNTTSNSSKTLRQTEQVSPASTLILARRSSMMDRTRRRDKSNPKSNMTGPQPRASFHIKENFPNRNREERTRGINRVKSIYECRGSRITNFIRPSTKLGKYRDEINLSKTKKPHNLIELYHNEAAHILSPSEANFTNRNISFIDLKPMERKKKMVQARVQSRFKPSKMFQYLDEDQSFPKQTSEESAINQSPKRRSSALSYLSPEDRIENERPKTSVKPNKYPERQPERFPSMVVTRNEEYPFYVVKERSPEYRHEGQERIPHSHYKRIEQKSNEKIKPSDVCKEDKQKKLDLHTNIQHDVEDKSEKIVSEDSNKIKDVTRAIQEFNFRQIPFVVAKSTTPSHNLGLNIQQVLSIIKTRSKVTGISPTLAHNMGLNRAGSSDLFHARKYRQKKQHHNCPFLEAEDNLVSDKELLGEIHAIHETTRRKRKDKASKMDAKGCKSHTRTEKERCSNVWDVRNMVKSSQRCTCYPSETMNYNQVLKQFLNEGEQIPSFLAPVGQNPPNSRMNKGRLSTDNASVMMNILSRDSDTTRKIKKGIRDLYGEYQELTAKERKLEADIENGLLSKITAIEELNALRQTIEAKEHKVNLVLSLHERMTCLKDIRSVMFNEQNSPPHWLPPDTASVRLTKLLRNIQHFQEHLKSII